MGIILGFICLLCCCILLAKMLTRKFNWETADKIMMRLHKPASAGLALFCPLHIIFAASVFRTRHLSIVLSGVSIAILTILIVGLCHILKDKRQKLRWHRILSIVLFLGILGHLSSNYWDFNRYQDKINNIQVQDVDISQVTDGKYIGTCDTGYIFAEVEVTVEKGRLSDIAITEHRNEKGKAAEKIVDSIITRQQVNVDTVSGATNSSLVIEKAVENALAGKNNK